MILLYDHDSDTLQTRTRRYERDRTLARVIVPDWPTIAPDEPPDWLFMEAIAANEDCPACDARFVEVYDAVDGTI